MAQVSRKQNQLIDDATSSISGRSSRSLSNPDDQNPRHRLHQEQGQEQDNHQQEGNGENNLSRPQQDEQLCRRTSESHQSRFFKDHTAAAATATASVNDHGDSNNDESDDDMGGKEFKWEMKSERLFLLQLLTKKNRAVRAVVVSKTAVYNLDVIDQDTRLQRKRRDQQQKHKQQAVEDYDIPSSIESLPRLHRRHTSRPVLMTAEHHVSFKVEDLALMRE
jgi:hypothetical protein